MVPVGCYNDSSCCCSGSHAVQEIAIELYTDKPERSLGIVPGSASRYHFIQHAYHCQPLLDANRFGWDLICNQDIVIKDRHPVEGPGYEHFGMDTFTLEVGYRWRTPADLLIIPVPNQTPTQWQPLSALIDTAVCPYPWFLSIRMIAKSFTIAKNTPLARVLPVDRKMLETPKILPVPPDIKEAEKEFAKNRNDNTEVPALKQYQDRTRKVHVEKPNRMDDVYIIRNFIDRGECNKLILAWYGGREPAVDDLMWSDKVRFTDLHDLPDRVLEVGRKIVTGCDILNPHLVRWKPGDKMPLHDDYGANNEYPEREMSAVIFLNDNYEGGEHFFEKGEIKPEEGMLLIHNGGRRKHGVREVRSGRRYTYISWLTRGTDRS